MFETISQIRQKMKSGENIGDAAALKLTLFSKKEAPSKFTEIARSTKEASFQSIDITEMLKFPEETLGYQYAIFLDRNNLQPLNFSDQFKEAFDRYPVALRYTRIHDLVHVITGFSTKVSGEIGVYAFIGEQNYSNMLNRSATLAKIIGRLMVWNYKENLEAEKRGKIMGKKAKPLIGEPIETWLDWPLEQVRKKVNIRGNVNDSSSEK